MFLNPKTILDYVRLPFDARAADFGTGAGHYALLLAERLKGAGSVYALDAYRPALDSLSRTALRRGLPLFTLESDLNRHIPLRDNLLKLGVVANVLHQLSDKRQFVQELARVVEPKGQVLVTDWVASFKNMGPTHESSVTPADAAQLFRSAGFTVGGMLPAGTHHFGFIAEVPSIPS